MNTCHTEEEEEEEEAGKAERGRCTCSKRRDVLFSENPSLRSSGPIPVSHPRQVLSKNDCYSCFRHLFQLGVATIINVIVPLILYLI